MQHLNPGKRPFVLSRSGYSGIQRYAALWTGDNVASDEHMLAGVRLVSNMGLAGLPFCGYDAGGFVGETSPSLYIRWMSIAALSPFFRAHKMINSRDTEPWAMGEEAEHLVRQFINLRYKLLPYLYLYFRQSCLHGLPVQRSLVLDYTWDDKIYDTTFQNQYLLGDALMVCPVESYKNLTKVYLPEGNWYDFYNDKPYFGGQTYLVECPLDKLPLFVKAGSIIPMQDVVPHTSVCPGDKTLHLHVYAGTENTSIEYYEDDGLTETYLDANFYSRCIHFVSGEKLEFQYVSVMYQSRYLLIRVYFHGFVGLSCMIGNNQVPLRQISYNQIEPMESFDPWAAEKKPDFSLQDIPFIEIEWKPESLTIILNHNCT
jgi:alpha-glucosidase